MILMKGVALIPVVVETSQNNAILGDAAVESLVGDLEQTGWAAKSEAAASGPSSPGAVGEPH